MMKVLRLALNDLRLTARDKTSLIWMLMLPLAMMWFFGFVFRDMGPRQKQITLTVVNHDDGWLSGAFLEDLDVDEIHLVDLTPEEAEMAENKVRTLIIPPGFTEKVLAGEQQELRLEKEPNKDEMYALAAQFHILKAIVRTTGRLVEINPGEDGPIDSDLVRPLILLLAEGEEGKEAAVALDADLETRFRALAGRERLVGLDVSAAGSGTPVPSGNAQSVPGILTMSVLMGTLIYGAVFLTAEKRDGTLRRQLCLPLGRRHVFAGKLLGRMFLACAQIILLLLAGKFVFGLPLENYLAGLALLMICYAMSVTGLSTLLGAVLRTDEQAGSLGWIITMAMSALGGCWWPSEVMPGWMWNVAHLLPTAWAMDGFHALISFGRGVEGVVLPCAALAVFGVIFSILGIRFLKTAGI